MEATDSVGELVDTCAAFCGTGNIPLLVGIPSYGFNHADIDTVCLAEDDSLAKRLSFTSFIFISWPFKEVQRHAHEQLPHLVSSLAADQDACGRSRGCSGQHDHGTAELQSGHRFEVKGPLSCLQYTN